MKSKKYFKFTGFTSTSCEEKKALEFAYGATKKEGEVPVLFVLDTKHDNGNHKTYLNHKGLSAFPNEQEYLIGYGYWDVMSIKEKVPKVWRSQKFEVTEIKLLGRID